MDDVALAVQGAADQFFALAPQSDCLRRYSGPVYGLARAADVPSFRSPWMNCVSLLLEAF